jgi:hypothetical protein
MIVALAVLPASAAAKETTLTLSGTAVTQSLLADLAYFYRHAVPDPPRFSFLGGGANTGVADAARGVVDAGMLARNLGPDDPPGAGLHPGRGKPRGAVKRFLRWIKTSAKARQVIATRYIAF